jgi:hypothetical protein
MIQTLPPGRADQPLREGILPRAGGRGQDFTDSHPLPAVPERGAGDRVAIAEEIRRRGVVREGVHDLLGRPGGRGTFGHVEVEDTPAIVGEDDQDEEHTQARGGHGEEIDGDQALDMIVQERAPGLRGRCAALRHQPGNGALGHLEAELEKLTVDSGSAPEGIRCGHTCDQGLELGVDRRAALGGPAGAPDPVRAEPAPVPPQDGVGGDDHEGLPPPGPDSGQPDPEEPIRGAEFRPGHHSPVYGELLAQGEVLQGELAVAAEDKLLFGPAQIEARIDQDTTISQQLSLWNQTGSRVIRGNLLVVPIDDALLYVEPLYLRAENRELPELKRLIASVGDRVVMGERVDTLLAGLFPGAATAGPEAPSPGPGRAAPTTEALQHYPAAFRALSQGDWRTFGVEMDALRRALEGAPRTP